jgi:hypothetical protein
VDRLATIKCFPGSEAAREAQIARKRQRRFHNFSQQPHKEAAASHRHCEVKAIVKHLQSQLKRRRRYSGRGGSGYGWPRAWRG